MKTPEVKGTEICPWASIQLSVAGRGGLTKKVANSVQGARQWLLRDKERQGSKKLVSYHKLDKCFIKIVFFRTPFDSH